MRFPIRFAGKVPKMIALHAEKGLTSCPVGSQNCVSSLNKDDSHVEPLAFKSGTKEAIERLKAIVLSIPNTRLGKQQDNYLWFECESEFFGFVDDLECQVLPEKRLIHVRSSSRLGRKDFSVNRKRVEAIRAVWLKG